METQTPLLRLTKLVFCVLGFAWTFSASAEPFAYVTNRNANTVSVIDTATNTVADTVSVGTQPRGIAVHPDGNTVYVGNTGSNFVSVIDTATKTVIDTVTVGNSPFGIAVHPDGSTVYVGNQEAATVSVIDTTTNTVVDTVVVGTQPYGVAVHPDGSTVYVANNTANTVSVIDTATNTVVDAVAVGVGPTAFGKFIGPLPASVGGSATGLSVRFVVCRNVTTGDVVRLFIPEGETSWDCTAAGLEALPGDIIFMFEAGIAE